MFRENTGVDTFTHLADACPKWHTLQLINFSLILLFTYLFSKIYFLLIYLIIFLKDKSFSFLMCI